MKTNALAVANRFVELSLRDKRPLRLLGLVKRVYIAHGFSLAFLHRGLLDPRFDKVEAWKYGPVIPSVYHSFKQYRQNPITDKTVVMEWGDDNEPHFVAPEVKDKAALRVIDMVWNRYQYYTDSQIVDLLHQKGTPWELCFIDGKNVEIPDELTEYHYRRILDYYEQKLRADGKQ